jgi:DNA-binding Lrp family transcriptional regulator
METIKNRLEGNSSSEIIDKAIDSLLIALLQQGLPLTARPYAAIAEQIGIPEAQVIARLTALKDMGLIKRFGVIVRHHELGYQDNAMIVWDIPDEQVPTVANRMKQHTCVTLCYRRPRRLPLWPYNLFCMIHGQNRNSVLQSLDTMIVSNGWQHHPYDVLFTRRRFKQRGACFPVNAGKLSASIKSSTECCGPSHDE